MYYNMLTRCSIVSHRCAGFVQEGCYFIIAVLQRCARLCCITSQTMIWQSLHHKGSGLSLIQT